MCAENLDPSEEEILLGQKMEISQRRALGDQYQDFLWYLLVTPN
jgi:hypothetical protein